MEKDPFNFTDEVMTGPAQQAPKIPATYKAPVAQQGPKGEANEPPVAVQAGVVTPQQMAQHLLTQKPHHERSVASRISDVAGGINQAGITLQRGGRGALTNEMQIHRGPRGALTDEMTIHRGPINLPVIHTDTYQKFVKWMNDMNGQPGGK